jgi:chromosomal replication initiation ATPase DnaA
MGITPGGTIGDMVEKIGDQLSKSGRPLLIDEADLVAKDGMIGVVRDIYESSQGTVILIGEEKLPQTLRRWERVHNRMLDWVAAQPADLREVGVLARLKCPGIEISPEVQTIVLERSQARARRIVVNLRQISEYALATGRDTITMEDVARITFFSGEAPSPRRLL